MQCSAFLAKPLKQHGGRGAKSDAGSVRTHAAKLQSKPNKRAEAPKDQQPIGDFFKRQQRRRIQSETAGGADGDFGAEARKGCASTAESMQLHHVSGNFTGIHSPTADAKISRLEASQTTGNSGTASSSGAAATYPHHDVGKSSEDKCQQQERSSLDGISQKQSDLGGRLVVLPGLEHTVQNVGGAAQEKGHLDGRHAVRPSGAGEDVLSGQGHCPLPFVEESTGAGSSMPMEIGCGSEASCTSPELCHPGWKQCVAVGGDQDASSQSESKQIGRPTLSAAQAIAETQKVEHITSEQMGCCLQHLALVNNDTQCYLNASFLTVCWCHLQCKGFESKSRISNSVFPKRWRVKVPNLRAKLRKVSGVPRRISVLAQSVGESKSRISKSVFPMRWRVQVPNLQQRFPNALESQSPESQRAFSRSVGESKFRIYTRWSVFRLAFSDSAVGPCQHVFV